MKIAFIAEACSAGVGRHVIDAALHHAGSGHEMHLLYSERHTDQRFALGLARLLQAKAHVEGFDIAHQPGLSDCSIIRQLRRYLVQKGPFDVVHCHSTKAGLAGRLAALGLGARVVYTPHAFYTMSPENGTLARLVIRALELSLSLISHAVVCVSQEEMEHAEGLGIAPYKLHDIPNGIDVREARRAAFYRQESRRRFGLQEDDVCIGFVGRLAQQKDPHLLLTAFLNSLDVLPSNVRLVIVGEGPLTPSLREAINAAGAQKRVILAGQYDGLRAMSAFDIFALPSRYEGFPYVLLEALAMGLPIVATAAGGVRAMVSDHENGFIVPPGKVDLFARALRNVVTSHELRDQMARCSLRKSTRFSLARMVDETEDVYRVCQPQVVRDLRQPAASRSRRAHSQISYLKEIR